MQINLQHNIQSEVVYNHKNKYIRGTQWTTFNFEYNI